MSLIVLAVATAAASDIDSALMHETYLGHDRFCATSLVRELREEWDNLPRAEQDKFNAWLAPGRAGLFEPFRDSAAPPDAGAPPSPNGPSCFGRQLDSWVDSQHFTVEYDASVLSADNARLVSDSLEESWTVLVDEHGFQQPDTTENYPMLVYVAPGGGGSVLAYTSIAGCGGYNTPYIVVYEDTIERGHLDPETTIAHEFFHAIQLSYTYYMESWYMEGTATWSEEVVYPASSDWSYHTYYYTTQLHLPMMVSSQSNIYTQLHTYGVATWGFHLEQNWGGVETMRQTWEYADGRQSGLGPRDIVEGIGLDFRDVFHEFMARMPTVDLEDDVNFVDPSANDTVYSLPDSGSSGSNQPGGLGMNIVEFDDSITDDGPITLQVQFDGSTSEDWLAVLVTTDGFNVIDWVPLSMSGSSGTADIVWHGEGPAFLVVAPNSQDVVYTYSYDWSADFEAAEVVDSGDPDDTAAGFGDDTGEEDDGKKKKNKGKGGGCSCASGPASGSGVWLFGLGAMALVRRRVRA